MIRAEHITKSFDGRVVLDDISIEFETGRTNLIIGNLNAGGTRPGAGQVPTGGYNFGRNEIRGLSFNYLKVSSYDL